MEAADGGELAAAFTDGGVEAEADEGEKAEGPDFEAKVAGGDDPGIGPNEFRSGAEHAAEQADEKPCAQEHQQRSAPPEILRKGRQFLAQRLPGILGKSERRGPSSCAFHGSVFLLDANGRGDVGRSLNGGGPEGGLQGIGEFSSANVIAVAARFEEAMANLN